MKDICFGIIGTGSIAEKFCKACAMTQGATAYAVVSRDMTKGQAFAGRNGVARVYDSVEEMLLDEQVDCVYVGTPHPIHYENCRMAILHGKHVLCEKPMVMNKSQAEELFSLARQQRVMLMEGMWPRFLPNTLKAMEWLREGRIGQLKMMDLCFSFAVDPEQPKDRLVNPKLGGGALYDVGVYTLEMGAFYAGANARQVEVYHTDYCPGTDASDVLIAEYPGGVLATMRLGLVCPAASDAVLLGTKGRIEIVPFYLANHIRLYEGNTLVEEHNMEYDVPTGLTWQLAAFCRYLREGTLQSPVVPPEDTIAAADIMGKYREPFRVEP